jgi:hypothetical protein
MLWRWGIIFCTGCLYNNISYANLTRALSNGLGWIVLPFDCHSRTINILPPPVSVLYPLSAVENTVKQPLSDQDNPQSREHVSLSENSSRTSRHLV